MKIVKKFNLSLCNNLKYLFFNLKKKTKIEEIIHNYCIDIEEEEGKNLEGRERVREIDTRLNNIYFCIIYFFAPIICEKYLTLK